MKIVLCYFKQNLDRRRQRNGKRQEESSNGLIQTQEPSKVVGNFRMALT